MITYIDPKITVDQLRYEMRVICRFSSDQDFTMKWVDEEGNLIICFCLFKKYLNSMSSFIQLFLYKFLL